MRSQVGKKDKGKVFLPLGATKHSLSVTSEYPGPMWHLLFFLQMFNGIYLPSPWNMHLVAITSFEKLDRDTVISWAPVRKLTPKVPGEDSFKIRYALVISSVSICQLYHKLHIKNYLPILNTLVLSCLLLLGG